MIHPASRLEVVVHGRANGRSAVKTAAYCARASYRDARRGQRFTERQRGGLLFHGLVNWAGDAESLWNAAEKAETRINARVVRELRPSLPAELPLDQQVRLVHGYCLWLRDTYGVAVQANVHGPRFKDPKLEAQLKADKEEGAEERYREAMFDPEKTNLNFHAHILITTREVDRETGAFGKKTRVLDSREDGPSEILKIRKAWEMRTNALLEEIGTERRVDLRSYADMAKADDAPEGLVSQSHLGPACAARGRRIEALEEAKFQGNIRLLAPHSRQAVRNKMRLADWDSSGAGVRREAIRRHNEDLWLDWMLRRARLREEAREVEEGFQEALAREVARKRTAQRATIRIRTAHTHMQVEAALADLSHIDILSNNRDLSSCLAQYLQKPKPELPDEFSQELDLEKYEPPPSPSSEAFLRIRQERIRVRGR